jgi:quinol monooxygenase YgiN
MIVVTGAILARPETVDELKRLSLEHTRRSRTEPGSISHDVHVNCENPLRIAFTERWADAVQFKDLLLGQRMLTSARMIEGADALLSTSRFQQLLVNGTIPAPIEAHLDEGIVERPSINLFGLSQVPSTSKISARAHSQNLSCAGKIDRHLRQRPVHPPFPAAPVAIAKPGLQARPRPRST